LARGGGKSANHLPGNALGGAGQIAAALAALLGGAAVAGATVGAVHIWTGFGLFGRGFIGLKFGFTRQMEGYIGRLGAAAVSAGLLGTRIVAQAVWAGPFQVDITFCFLHHIYLVIG
jgi:hypothetical protein